MAWEAFTPTTNFKSFYRVFRRYGDNAAVTSADTFITATDATGITTFPPFQGTWSYVVYQVEQPTNDTVGTTNASAIVATSPVTNVAVIRFVNNVVRADGGGGQTGQGQLWNITYKVDVDANVSFAVYYPTYTPIAGNLTNPPTGLYDADSSSVTSGGAAAVVKRILNKVPRSGVLAGGSVTNTDTWDVRDSNGTLVPNGIYNLVISAYNTGGSVLGSAYFTIPVDVLRITNPAATAITDTLPNSTISYNLTGNATVRIFIATSTAGGVLPQFILNATSDVVLNVGTTVQIITEAKAAGSQSTIWNGLDLAGVAVSSGQYAFAISAKDTSGNGAVGPNSNDYFITGSIAVNRTPPVSNLTALTQVQNLNVVWAPSDKSATISWDTAGAGITYSVFRKFGVWRDTTTFFASVSTVASGVSALTYKDTVGPGTWTYGVRATSGTSSGGPISAITAETSRNRFIRSISAVDGLGGQLGQGGKWTFSYKIEDNAEVDLIVLTTSTLLGTDANGFATYLASDVVKVVISSVPRASEGSGSSWTNSDIWDQTNAAGVQVSSGIYTVLLRSRLPATNPYYPPALRDVVVMQVPVTPAPPVVGQVQNVNVAWGASDKSATVSWTALAGATGYTVYRKFGIWASTTSFMAGASTVTTGVIGTTYKDTVGPGAWTYGVLGEGVVGTVSAVSLDTSKNRFIQSLTQVDGIGGQLGQGGKWTFTYKVEDNADVDIIVLSSNSLLGTDANGFATYKTTDVVKVAVSSAPRAGMGSAGGIVNTDVWDQTDLSGAQVSSGIYTVLFQAHLSTGNPYLPPVDRDVIAIQIPVVTTTQQQVGQVQGLNVVWAPADKSATLSWTTLAGASGYSVYRKFGIWNSTSSFFTGASTITTGVVGTTYKDVVGPGAWTYGVRAEGVGGSISAVNLETSRNRFIRSVSAVDGVGGQLGKGGLWTFSYRLEENAVVDILILSSNTQLGINANGFATYRDTDVVKIIIASAPRAAEGTGAWTNSDSWNLTDTNGQGAPQGIYTVLFQAHLSTGNPYLPPVDRDVYVMQVTIDKTAQAAPGDSTPPSVSSTFPAKQGKLTRVTQLSAVLSDNVALNLTASSIVLSRAGSTVPIAGVQSPVGSNSIYFTLSYSSDSVVADSYSMTVVPVDQALNTGQPYVVTFIVDPTSPTIVSVSPSTGTTLTATFTSVSVKLSDLGGSGLDLAGSQLTLTNPSGASITGTVTNNGTDTLTLTIPEQKFNGAYTVTVIARDQAGNVTTLSGAVTLNVPLSATTEEFGKTLTVDQNPARAPVTVTFDVPAAGDSTFEVFNLLGERVYTKSLAAPGGGSQKILWNLVNDDQGKIGTGVYTYRVRFTGGGTNLEAKKKLVVVQ